MMRRYPPPYTWAVALVLFCVLAVPAHAVIRNWDPSVGSFDWDVAGNWDPSGVPTTDDDVTIDTNFSFLFLSRDTEEINFLDVTTTLLQTNGFRLKVRGAAPVPEAMMTIRGGATSGTGSVVVFPVGCCPGPQDLGLSAWTVRVANRGVLTLQNDGANASITDGLIIDLGGEFRGSGDGTHSLRTSIFGAGRAVDNNGTITAAAGTTVIGVSGDQVTLDLDGEFEVGIVDVLSGATLRVDDLDFVQTDTFDGTMNIGAGGATAVLDYPAWSVGANGVVSLDNGEIRSRFLQNNGEIRGHGTVAVTDWVNNGALSGDGGTLVVAPTGSFNFSSNPGAGVLNAVTGDLEIVTGVGLSGYDGEINVGPGHELRTDDEVELLSGGSTNLTGGAIVAGFTAEPLTTVHVMAGPESRIEILPGKTIALEGQVVLEGELRLVGHTTVSSTASFQGPGTLIVDAETTLRTAGSLTLGGGLRNEGIVTPGLSAGQITAGADYVQMPGATLGIELGGVTPGTGYDVLGAGGQATLAGTLDISLIDGFSPSPGDLFTVLTADGGIVGTFDTVNLPPLDPVVGMNVIYNLRNVTLAVTAQLLLGDANNDGQVTGADLIAVQQNFGDVGLADGLLLGDANDDGQVTGADLISVQQNFGNTLGPAGAGVPEPASCVALLLVALSLAMKRPAIEQGAGAISER